MEAIPNIDSHAMDSHSGQPRWQRIDGHYLAGRVYGAPGRVPVVLLHGFGQSQQAWKDTGTRLAEHGFQAFSYDARGHGESDYAEPHRYRPDDFVADLKTVCSTLDRAPLLVGASMGGLTAMLAATEAGIAARALVLVDITPSWRPEGLQKILGFLQSNPRGFENLDQVKQALARYLPHRRAGITDSGLLKNLRRGADGRLRWHWDPAMLALATKSELYQQRFARAARHLGQPTLLISGGRSELLADEQIREFLELVPHAEHAAVADATHRIAGDDNTAFNRIIIDYLGRLASDRVKQCEGA